MVRSRLARRLSARPRLARRLGAPLAAVILVLAAPAAQAAPARPDILGSVAIPADTLAALPLWRRALADQANWLADLKGCLGRGEAECASLPEKVWLARIEGLATLPAAEKASAANLLVNQLLGESPPDPAAPDPATPAAPAAPAADAPWPTLGDLLGAHRQPAGDLALALAKYHTLRAAGVPAVDVRVVATHPTLGGGGHFLAVTRVDGDWQLLGSAGGLLEPAGRSSLFAPLYSFNETTRWVHFPARLAEHP
ncbi:hypothetical protein [Roseospirillum parvum]|uniref:Uncharacterized protein n=1 Tax=Roseospirillum parvum TaxID=83401 RepID=A0A1G7TJG2_9PROT|nr:hypothetical protein [Roseospirillum parvum]SDG35458.1 hypothetical protein SAMN05421742_10116 [Roseospirillum parvum]